jgi:hypothetical protein
VGKDSLDILHQQVRFLFDTIRNLIDAGLQPDAARQIKGPAINQNRIAEWSRGIRCNVTSTHEGFDPEWGGYNYRNSNRKTKKVDRVASFLYRLDYHRP